MTAEETPYEIAWQKYRMSSEYARAYKVLRENGINMPYLENILRGAFDFGYNNRFLELTSDIRKSIDQLN